MQALSLDIQPSPLRTRKQRHTSLTAFPGGMIAPGTHHGINAMQQAQQGCPHMQWVRKPNCNCSAHVLVKCPRQEPLLMCLPRIAHLRQNDERTVISRMQAKLGPSECPRQQFRSVTEDNR